MKITKKINGNDTYYFYDGIKKYGHFKGRNRYECWREYDVQGNHIHLKNNNGYEWWSIDNPNNPNNPNNSEIKEEDIKPFSF